MNSQILVAYASKYGATGEIAEQISEILRQSGLAVDLMPVDQVRDIEAYTAVVLGSAVYMGHWRKEAVNFLEFHASQLAELDVWLFSSGPTGEGDPIDLLQGWGFPKGQQDVADRIRPVAIAVFHGTLHQDKLNLIEKWIVRNVKAPVGDFRDWGSIEAWATTIADSLREPA